MLTQKAVHASRTETIYRSLLVLGSVVFALGIFETLAWFGVFDYRSLLANQTSDGPADIPDRELLHRHPPHSHLAGSSRGGQISVAFQIPATDKQFYKWDVHYDQNGFRNPSDFSQADLAVIGDSFVEAMTIADPLTMTFLLAGMQHQTVANLGQYGYGPREELIVLKRYGLPLHPRTVVWMFYEANDLGDVIHHRNAIRQMDSPVTDAGPRRSFVRHTISTLHNHISRAFRYANRPSGLQRAGTVKTAEGRRLTEYFNYDSHPYSANDLSALEETASILQTAEKLSAAQGARFVFVFIPSKFRAFHDSCEFPAQSECRRWVLTDLSDRLRAAVGPLSATVGYVDLTPDMVSAVKKRDFPYYSDDDHWSEAGNRIAAGAINRYLQEMQR